MLETRLIKEKNSEKYEYKDGYFLSIEELEKLCMDFLEEHYSAPYDGNKKTYIENWIKTNEK
jgi:hypothetical protein